MTKKKTNKIVKKEKKIEKELFSVELKHSFQVWCRLYAAWNQKVNKEELDIMLDSFPKDVSSVVKL